MVILLTVRYSFLADKMLRIQKFLQIILILILTCPFSFAVTNNQKNSIGEYLSAEKLTTFIPKRIFHKPSTYLSTSLTTVTSDFYNIKC